MVILFAASLTLASACSTDAPVAPVVPAGATDTTSTHPQPGVTWKSLAVGGNHNCALDASGNAYCWGYSLYGQSGTLISASVTQPTKVPGGQHFASISAGNNTTCGVTADGSAFCWGLGAGGQLGVAQSTPLRNCQDLLAQAPCTDLPLRVNSNERLITVSSGHDSACALNDNGRAFSWGYNTDNALGAPTTGTCGGTFGLAPCSYTPVAVSGGMSFVSISVGGTHVCAIDANHDAYCWGTGLMGRLGTGDSLPRATPSRVAGGIKFASVSAGAYYTCGVSVDQIGYCWGPNTGGQIGRSVIATSCYVFGTTPCAFVPTPVETDQRMTTISAGKSDEANGAHSCAVSAAGRAICWGMSSAFQTGAIGEQYCAKSICVPVPRIVPGDLSFTTIGEGYTHTCGLTTTGDIYCWGADQLHQLGDGVEARGSQLTPTKILPAATGS